LFVFSSTLQAQERMENPFLHKPVVVISDASAASLAGITVLLGVSEFPVREIIVPSSISVSERKKVKQLVKEEGKETIPVVSEFMDSTKNDSGNLLCLCMASPSVIPADILVSDGLYRVVIWDTSSVHTNNPYGLVTAGSGKRSVPADLIRPDRQLILDHEDLMKLRTINTRQMHSWSLCLKQEKEPALGYELLPVYLLFPETFDMEPSMQTPALSHSIRYDAGMMKGIVMEILAGQYRAGEGVAFSGFPIDSSLYKYDVRFIMQETVRKYGPEEWKACVLTDEIHGHLGIYSVIGAKMGIRAREYFHAGLDKLKVISFGGNKPPKSCFNDGLQASTGATIGQGLITVVADDPRPEAVFGYQGRQIRIKLKDSYRQQIESDIQKGVVRYGLLNAGYWKMIRNISLNYWKNWDRNEIFDIVEIQNNP